MSGLSLSRVGRSSRLFSALFALSISWISASHAEGNLLASKDYVMNSEHLQSLTFSSRSENLIINDVIVNRGCQPQGRPRSGPLQLNFGETIEYGTYLCDPIEVVVETNLGREVFVWDQGVFIQGDISVKKSMSSVGRLLTITNWSDHVRVLDYTINRGTCQNTFSMHSNEKGVDGKNLKFGQRYIIVSNLCDPIEITVKTDRSTETFNW